MNDGVFLMVYLPAPYEQSLTQLARAASITSSRGAEPPGRRNKPIEQPPAMTQDQAQIHNQTQERVQDKE